MTQSSQLTREKSGLSDKHWKILSKLDTPAKIQNYLNQIPFNFQDKRRTFWSVARSIDEGKVHCVEGALLAACALWIQGEKPLLLDLRTAKGDEDHVVALFKRDGKWGALSKTNHPVLRYRDPIYRDIRELAMSYFHEYFLGNGAKTLREYSDPFDLSKEGREWVSGRENLFSLVDKLDESKHHSILTPDQIKNLRKAEDIEIQASQIKEYNRK